MPNHSASIYLFFLQICISCVVSYKFEISTEDCLVQRVNPDNLKYLSLKVVNKDTDHPTYNLEVESQAERAGAPYGARFLTVQNGNCSVQCTHQIVAFRARNMRTHRTILYALDFQGSMIAPNYQDVKMDSPIRCARQFGYCGATIGLYRHFRYTPGGLLNAYSFSSQVNILGFTREYYPMCYLWTLPDDLKIIGNANMSGRSPRATTSMCMSNESIPITDLQLLRVYDNNAPGTQRDHYYTITTNDTNSDLAGYTEQAPLGRVVLSPTSSCDCLTKIVQMIDKQEGIFRRLDHKLIVEGAEPDRPYEQYNATGEAFYCASEMACGATLPLWKSFHYFDVDSVITTNSEPVPYSYLYPQLPLCYIWPVNDEPSTTTNPTLVAPDSTAPVSTVAGTDQTMVSISPEGTTIIGVPTTISNTLSPPVTDAPNMESSTTMDPLGTTSIPSLITTSNTITFPIDSSQPTTVLPDFGTTTPPPLDFLTTSTMASGVGGIDAFSTIVPPIGIIDGTSTLNPIVDGLDGISITTPSGITVDGLSTVIPTAGISTVGDIDDLTTPMLPTGDVDGVLTTIPTTVVDGTLATIVPPIGGTDVLPTSLPSTVDIMSPATTIPGEMTSPSIDGLPQTTTMINTINPSVSADDLDKMFPEMSKNLINLFFGYETEDEITPEPFVEFPVDSTKTVLNYPANTAGTTVSKIQTVETTTTTITTTTTAIRTAETLSATSITAGNTQTVQVIPTGGVESTTLSTVFTSTSVNGQTSAVQQERKGMSVSNPSDEFFPTVSGLDVKGSMTETLTSTTGASLTFGPMEPNEAISIAESSNVLGPKSSVNISNYQNGTEGVAEARSVPIRLPIRNDVLATPAVSSPQVQNDTETVSSEPPPEGDPGINDSRDIFSYSIPNVL